MVNSRQKGKRGEREFRDILRAHGWTEARRGQQFAGGPDSPDVMGGPAGFHFEVKYGARNNIEKAMVQAMDDSAIADIPVVASRVTSRGKSGEWLLTIHAEDLLPLLRELETLRRTP